MFAKVFRNLAGAVAIFSILAGCAHQYPDPVVVDGAPPQAAAEPYRTNGILEFCAQNEWVCILAGLAAFGATVAIISSTGGDSDSQSQ